MRFDPREGLKPGDKSPATQVMHVEIFGPVGGAGHTSPHLGLEVVWGPEASNYRPKPSNDYPRNHSKYQKLAENIYEIY